MKNLLPLIVLLLSYSLSFGQTTKTPCNDFNQLLGIAVESLNQRDEAKFRSLVSFPMAIKSMEYIQSEMDKENSEMFQAAIDVLKNNEGGFFTDMTTVFTLLVEHFDTETKSKDWQMVYLGYYQNDGETDTASVLNTLSVDVSVNGKKYRMVSRCFRDNGCQYMILPFEPAVEEAQ